MENEVNGATVASGTDSEALGTGEMSREEGERKFWA